MNPYDEFAGAHSLPVRPCGNSGVLRADVMYTDDNVSSGRVDALDPDLDLTDAVPR